MSTPAPQRSRTESGDREVMIEVRGLWKVFGRGAEPIPADPAVSALSRSDLAERTGCSLAVRDVDLTVGRGEVFMVMGLSGSGKSTLVRCLTRLVEPTAGRIRLAGEDVTAASETQLRQLRRDRVGMVFQHFGLLPHRRVADNIGYGLQIRGVPAAQRRARVADVIDMVGLSGFADRYPAELSGGMRQRVGLARALAGHPDVLLLDEPFSALDPLTRRDMQDELARLQREIGTTMVFITHDLTEALRLGDRVMVMRDGEAVQTATGGELVAAPVDEYVRRFVREVSPLDVLALRDVVRPAAGLAPCDLPGPALGGDVLVRDAAATILDAVGPLPVVDGAGRLVGVVGREEVLALLAPRAA